MLTIVSMRSQGMSDDSLENQPHDVMMWNDAAQETMKSYALLTWMSRCAHPAQHPDGGQ